MHLISESSKEKKKSGNSILGCSKPSFCKVQVGSNALELRSCINKCKATLAFGRFPVWPRDWLHPNKGLKTRSSILMRGSGGQCEPNTPLPSKRNKGTVTVRRHKAFMQPANTYSWGTGVPGSVLGSGGTVMAQTRQPGAVDQIHQIQPQ